MSARPGAGIARVTPATAALAGMLFATAVVLVYAGRHLTFFYDEWNFVLDRRGASLSTYLDPHNGHLSLFPVIIYKLLFKLVGLHHYTPYRVVLVAFDLVSGALLYVLAVRRLGRWLALAPTVLLLLIGTSFHDLLWPFQIGFLGSVAAGLGALVLLDRSDAGGRSDGLAAALLIYSVGSSGVGLAYLVGSAVMLIAQRTPWRRMWVVGLPALLFVIWYVGWETNTPITSASLLGTPQFIADAASSGFAGISGLSLMYGPPIAVAALIAIALAVHRRGAAGQPLLLAAIAGALVFWGLSAIARSTQPEPDANRYVYVSAVFILLAVVEAARGVRLGRPALALLCVLVGGGVIANLGQLRLAERGMVAADNDVLGSLAATDIAAPVVSASFRMSPSDAPQLTAGPYLAAERALGTPAPTLAELERAPGGVRTIADQTLVLAERIRPVQAAVAAAPCTAITVARGSRAGRAGLAVHAGQRLLIETGSGPVTLYLRRFGSLFSATPAASLPAHSTSSVGFPADRAPAVPWTALLAGADSPRACVG